MRSITAAFLALLALPLCAQNADKGIQHVKLPQTKVSQLLLHREDGELLMEGDAADPLPIFFITVIGSDGHVFSAVPLRGQDLRAIKPAEEALKKWTWKPVQMQGKPVMIDTLIAVHFGIESHMAKAENGWRPLGLMEVNAQDAESLISKGETPPLPADGEPGGIVKLRLTITEKGEPINLAIASAPTASMGHAVMEAVKDWKFHPLVIDDRPVAVDTTLNIKFKKK